MKFSEETSQWSLETIKKLPEGTQPQLSPGELLAAEEVIRADETVRKLAKDVGMYSFFDLSSIIVSKLNADFR